MRLTFNASLVALAALIFTCFNVYAQWDPNAGVVPSFSKGKPATTTSNPGSSSNATDDNENTAWQGTGVLPTGYIGRTDLNIMLGKYPSSYSGTPITPRMTDGNLGNSAGINLSNGKSWVHYDFATPVPLRHVSIKAQAQGIISVYAFRSNGDSLLLGTLTVADDYQVRRFSPMLTNVVKIKLTSTARFTLFEIAALSKIPTEYLTVDLGQTRQVGYIETRHWANGGAQATNIYISNDNVNWIHAGGVYPDALKLAISRPPQPTPARYVKVEHSMNETDYASAYVWEVRVYDKNGPWGPFQAPKPHKSSVYEILGVNGIWGWGHNMFAPSIPQGEGPTRFNKVGSHARNYHNMHWDVDDPDIIPPYSTMHIVPNQMGLWWLDWNREYKGWNDAGLKVQASIQFNEWIPQTRMVNWDNPYQAAYNYGYAFARHFGPTHGNGLVDVIEIGNEPWTYPAAFYLTILQGMLKGVKDGDPALKAIPCALQSASPDTESPVGGNWMGARLTAAEAPLIDGINIHHYSYTFDSMGTRIGVHPEHPESAMHGAVNDVRFRDKNLPGKKIYLSEWGWDSDGAGESCTFGECVTEYEQAIYGVRGAMMFMRLGIDRLTWYFYGNQGSGNLYSRSGMESSNTTSHQEKKSLKSFRSFVDLLGDRHFLDTLREDNNAWIYLFGDSLGNPTHIAAWRPIDGNDNSTIQINLTTTLRPDSAWTIKGNSYTGETASVPAYANGVMNLQLTAAPLIVKVTPVPTNPLVWTGNSSNAWNSPLNWNSYTVPTATSNVLIPTGRPHYPDSYTNDPVVGTITLKAGATMTLHPGDHFTVHTGLVLEGGTLKVTSTAGITPDIHIKGNLTRTGGSFIHGNGKIFFDGTTPQTISGNFNFYNVVVNNTTDVQTLNAVSVAGVLSVMNNAKFTTNDNVTLESGASLMHGANTPGNQTGTVVGNVKVKRNGAAGNRYKYYSSPVSGANANSLGGAPYYYDPSRATDTSESGLRNGWVLATGTMQPAVGYIAQGVATANFTGIPFSAPVAAPATTAVKKNVGTTNNVPFNLVGNPFPSALDAAKFLDKNGPNGTGAITGALYFWDDDGTGGSGWNAVQDYAVWNGAGLVAGPNSGTMFSGHIASCQSFFVEKVSDGTTNVMFDNSMRTTQNNAFFRMMPMERLWVNLVNPNNDYNETLIAFKDDATDGVDPLYDARKLYGNEGIAFYSILSGKNLAIQAAAPLTGGKIISLGFKTNVAGNHTLSLKQIEGIDESIVVWLEDKVTGTFQNLRLNSVYSFNSIAGTFDNRFYLHFNPALEVTALTQECEDETGEIMLHQPGTQLWDFVVADAGGNVIQSADDFSGTTYFDVAAGTYTLTFTDNGGYTFTRNVEVSALPKVTGDFILFHRPRTPVVGTTIFFQDNSVGSTSNEWSFGDGSTETNAANPTHVYNRSGIFNVTLRAWNNDCERISTKTIFISGQPAATMGNTQPGTRKTTGIADEEENALNIYTDGGEHIFVAFSFNSETKASVQLHDVAGKLLYASDVVTKDIQQIDVPSLAQAMYVIRVITADKTYTQKLFLGTAR